MRKIVIIVFIMFSLFLFPIHKINAQTSNVGFVKANIWYSQDPFEEGDKINIYTLVFNPDEKELSGTVVFLDNNILLGKKDFIVPANGVKEVHISWIVTVGNHTIFGKIENAKFLISKGIYEDTYLLENETAKSSITVSKKIIPIPDEIEVDPSLNTENTDSGLLQNISDTIKDKTPTFISEPINSTSENIEKFRENLSISSENKKEELINEIDVLNNSETSNENKLLKPFKYIKLFFFKLSSSILKNKFLFYGILSIITFLILRLIWRKIFKKS